MTISKEQALESLEYLSQHRASGFLWRDRENTLQAYIEQQDARIAELEQQREPLRYTADGKLAECPCCGSLDVGGAHDTVSCYRCGLTVTKPAPLQNAHDAWNERTGRTDPAQGEAVAMRQRFDEIEREIAEGKHTAASVFTQMRTAALYRHPAPAQRS